MMASEFEDETQRYTLYPIRHHDIWREYKNQLASFWIADEIDFAKDREQFDALPPEEQHLIKSVLAFFAGTDAVVALNVMQNFCSDIPILEAQVCYTYQSMMENVHSEAYSMMIDTYISDPVEKERVLTDMAVLPSVQRKMRWAEHYKDRADQHPLAERLAAFVIVEGLFFSSSFAVIFWYKQKNALQALTKSNTLIARDEGQHVKFGTLLYRKCRHRLPADALVGMMREAVDIEKEFVREMIGSKFAGMNVDLMNQYVEYVADTLVVMLGLHERVFHRSNPFSFMDLLGMDGRDNFFEGVPTQYRKSGVLNESRDLALTDDF